MPSALPAPPAGRAVFVRGPPRQRRTATARAAPAGPGRSRSSRPATAQQSPLRGRRRDSGGRPNTSRSSRRAADASLTGMVHRAQQPGSVLLARNAERPRTDPPPLRTVLHQDENLLVERAPARSVFGRPVRLPGALVNLMAPPHCELVTHGTLRTVTETTLPRSRARAPESRAWAVAPVGKVVSITVLRAHRPWRGGRVQVLPPAAQVPVPGRLQVLDDGGVRRRRPGRPRHGPEPRSALQGSPRFRHPCRRHGPAGAIEGGLPA